jgi:hypothetical protein
MDYQQGRWESRAPRPALFCTLRRAIDQERTGRPVSATCLSIIYELQIDPKILTLQKRDRRL